MNDIEQLAGRPVAVLGLGLEGLDLCRYLLGRGARVTVFDTRGRTQVAAAAAEVESQGGIVRLGMVDPDVAPRFEALFVSQSVLLHRDALVARMRGLGRPVASMMQAFLRAWPGPTVGVTGSSGKTTTTSLVAAAFRSAGPPHIVGGNIGAGLLGQLKDATPQTWAILEISHTQLQCTDRSPHIAAVTNVTPNHLDQFSWDEYVDLKRNLVRYQRPEDVVVLNAAEPVAASLGQDTPASRLWFNDAVAGQPSFVVDNGTIVRLSASAHTSLMPVDEIPLRGAHNVENVLTAAAVAFAAGISDEAFVRAVRSFQAVPHRLEPVATIDGVQFVNDSIGTAPERTLAGLRSFDEPIVLLLGGRDKQLPLDDLMSEAHGRCRAIVCFGESATMLYNAAARVQPSAGGARLELAPELDGAFTLAAGLAHPGDVVLLSPACTSFDAYPNFESRGEAFRALVRGLELAGAGKEGTPSRL